MKSGCRALFVAFLIAGCQRQEPEAFSYQTIYLLPDGRVEFLGDVGTMDSILPKLPNPSAVHINIAACTTAKTEQTVRLARALQAAGYDEIGLIGVGADRKSACAR